MPGFDAYHKWLGIPPREQPPHHYRLLGIDLFESDPDVIDSAANKQMAYLKSCANGPHVALSQQLLNEVAAARICLLNAGKRSAYDAELKIRLAAAVSDSQPLILPPAITAPPASAMAAGRPVPIPEQLPPADPLALSGLAAVHPRRSPWRDWRVQVGAGSAGVLVISVVLALALGGTDSARQAPPKRTKSKPAVVAQDPEAEPEQESAPGGGANPPAAADRKLVASVGPAVPSPAGASSLAGSPVPVATKPAAPAPVPLTVSRFNPTAMGKAAPPAGGPTSRLLTAGSVPGQRWDGNGAQISLCWCPPGTFVMGSPESEMEAGAGVRLGEDQIPVTLTHGFWMGRYEVTQEQWQKVMGTTLAQQAQRTTPRGNFAGQGANYPMYFVNHEEVTEFCRKLTEQERQSGNLSAGWEYRLPTEAQWEYACRAGTQTPFSFGAELNGDQANCNGVVPYGTSEPGPNLGRTAPCGSYQPNAFGLFDMHGNVAEWCRDWAAPVDSETVVPKQAVDPAGPDDGTERMIRGGGWNYPAGFCRSATRMNKGLPSLGAPSLGFRVICEPTLKSSVPSSPAPMTTANPQLAVGNAESFAGVSAGQEWSGNGLGMKFCWCPAGSFAMGSVPNERGRGNREDQAEVTLTRGFWLGKYEVTQGEWERLMGSTVLEQAKKGGAVKSNFGVGETFPMYYVSHDEALDFCRKLTDQERQAGTLPPGWQYRLPTEAQWEFACRAGTATPFSFGMALNGDKANCNGHFPYGTAKQGTNLKKAKPVGTFKPNAFGLFDMHGNVWEWCRDSFSESSSRSSTSRPLIDPQGQSGLYRALRGGGWDSNAVACRSACRFGNPPANRYNIVGFRVVCER